MASNERRDKPVPVKKGTSAPGRRPSGLESPQSPRSDEDLDSRQERIRETRRKGPELKREGDTGVLEAPAEAVPPTECDDEHDQ